MKKIPASNFRRFIPGLLIVGIAVYIFWSADLPYESVPNENVNEIQNENSGVAVNDAVGGPEVPTSFDECTDLGYPVQESYPRTCAVPGGQMYTENIGNELEMLDEIRLDAPRPNQTVSSPLALSGEAVGTWFFEASFSVVMEDTDGNELGSTIAQAQGDWMTTGFVTFTATLEFAAEGVSEGTLILQAANPSGLEDHADELRVPVNF